MRRRLLLIALLGLGSTALVAADAPAGDWGCGGCGSYGYPTDAYYAPPTYSYAPPTVTVVPHYIVRPHYVVKRTYVVRPTYYLDALQQPRPCRRGLLVNQGQYDTEATTIVSSCY